MNSEDMYNVISELSPTVLDEAEKYKFGKDYTPIKILAAAACILFLICGSVPVMAACDNEAAYRLMYSIAPSFAQRLKPVCLYSENKGIVMEVVGAEIDGGNMNILVSMRDTEGDRIGDMTDLYDSYSIHTPYDQYSGCSFAGFDEETKTAYFTISIDQGDHPLNENDKISFSVGEILPYKEYTCTELEMIDLDNLLPAADVTTDYDLRGGSGLFIDEDGLNAVPVISSGSSGDVALTDGVTLEGFGIVDGYLHIQIKYDSIGYTDNHGFIYLTDPSGERIDYDYSLSWWDTERINSYDETCFKIPESGLQGYKIMGEFWTCNDGPIEGPWSVTIPVSMLE
ncbi:MAG: hypothetical protein J5476_01345 [Lachnospiraceae bacterium]|nr:hypothetical protein [Lachnospiraceae bacterium]